MAVYRKTSLNDFYNGMLINDVSGLICELSPDYAKDTLADEKELIEFCELIRQCFAGQSLYYYFEIRTYSSLKHSMGLWGYLKNRIEWTSQTYFSKTNRIELSEGENLYGVCEFPIDQISIVLSLLLEMPSLSFAIIHEKGNVREFTRLLSKRYFPSKIKDINSLLADYHHLLLAILGNNGMSLCCLTLDEPRELNHRVSFRSSD